MTPVSIVKLTDHPEMLDTVARWIDGQWGAFSGRSLEQTRARFELELHREQQLPVSLIALDGGVAVGLATLRDRDSVDWDPQATPWICNVYVDEAARGKSVGSKLCRALEEVAKDAGYREIHLATVMASGSLYERLGYTHYRVFEGLQYPMYLMRRTLGS